MPQAVYNGTHGTLLRFTRTGDNALDRTVLGSFETWTLNTKQNLVDHTGPKDSWEYSTPVKAGWSVSVTRWIPSSDATPDDDDGAAADADVDTIMEELVVPDSTVVVFSGKTGGGTTCSGNVHWTSDAFSKGSDADKETIEFQGTGALSFS